MYDRIRGLREDANMNQTEMAKLLGIHQTTYSDYELGANIPLDSLVVLALFHKTSIDYLLGLTDERSPYPRAKKRL